MYIQTNIWGQHTRKKTNGLLDLDLEEPELLGWLTVIYSRNGL